MKQLITTILFTFLAFTIKAQSAEKIVEQVKQHYKNGNGFTANVHFEIDIPENQPLIMNGKLFLKGNKYKFELPEQEIISDNITIWHWNKGDINEIQVSYVEKNEGAITPAKVFNEFLKGYNYKLDSTPIINGKKVALIEITPSVKSDLEDIFKIKVVADTNANTVEQMQIFTKDGVVYTFTISNQLSKTLQDSLFQFNATEHPSVEIIDLR